MNNLSQKHCEPCEAGALPLARADIEKLLVQLPGWELSVDAKSISKTYPLKDFAGALAFTNKVGALAEAENHHPDLFVAWGKVGITLSTHSIGGISENDIILAAKIEEIS